jgi:hypothetical protein
MPQPASMGTAKKQQVPPSEEATKQQQTTPEPRTRPSAPRRTPPRQPRPARRRISWPSISFPKLSVPGFKRSRPTSRKQSQRAKAYVELPQADEVTMGNGALADPPVLPEEITPPRSKKQRRPKRKPLRTAIRQFKARLGVLTAAEKKRKPREKKKRVQTRRGRYTRWVLFALLLVVLPLSAVAGRIALQRNAEVDKNSRTRDANIENQIKVLGASSFRWIANAESTAERMAYECFTVPNYGATSGNDNLVDFQNKALANAAIKPSPSVNCGWDGNGRGKVDAMQVVNDSYWIHADHTTVILQIKLYQRPGFFYYFVPFKNNNGQGEVSGMPSIFGTYSGAEDFMASCPDPNDTANTDELQHTAQAFLKGLTGDSSIDLGYLTYAGAKFGGFGPAVSSPKITQVKYCGTTGQEKRFAVMVQFNGPVQGSKYTLPYAFGVVPNPETNGRYQVKEFGPAPGYSGD